MKKIKKTEFLRILQKIFSMKYQEPLAFNHHPKKISEFLNSIKHFKILSLI